MAEYTLTSKSDAEYYRSGSWICKPLPPFDPSPTGAHHWIEVTEVGVGIFMCKYCFESRKFATTFSNLQPKIKRSKPRKEEPNDE